MIRHTPEQESEFKRLFSMRRKRQLLLAVPLIAAIITMLVKSESASPAIFGISQEVYAPAFLVFVVAALIFSFLNWRCPACKGYLGKAISPRFCAKCGAVLQ
jgi:hypothetical protein